METFEGDYVQGRREGQGRFTVLDNGETPTYQYDGEWLAGKVSEISQKIPRNFQDLFNIYFNISSYIVGFNSVQSS